MLSLPLSKTLESQLTAEQSLTGRHWNSPKKIPHIQRQRRSHNQTVERSYHNKIKLNNCWVGDSQTGEYLYHRSPPTGRKALSPTSGFQTWGSGNGRRNSYRITLWRLAGFDCRTSAGLRDTETPLLEGTHKVVCISGPRGKNSDPIGDWTRPTC